MRTYVIRVLIEDPTWGEAQKIEAALADAVTGLHSALPIRNAVVLDQGNEDPLGAPHRLATLDNLYRR